MKIGINVGMLNGGCSDDICEVRGHVGPTGKLMLLIVARPKVGDYAGKVVVFNLGVAVVEVFDPETKEHAEIIERIKNIPPAKVELDSTEDAECAIPEPEPSKIIPAHSIPQLPG